MSRKNFVMYNKLWVPQVPKDCNALTLGGNYQFACMKNHAHASIFWMFGNLAADCTISLEQATNIGGGSSKALTIPNLYRLQTNAGDNKDQDRFVLDGSALASRLVTNTAPAEDNYVFVAEVEGEDFDVTNKFDCIRPKAVCGSGASLLTMFIIFGNARFQGDLAIPSLFPSVLAGEQEVIPNS